MTRKSTKTKAKAIEAAIPTVRKELPQCEGCGSTKLKVLRKNETEHHGIFADHRYTSVVRQKAQCSVCGQVQMLLSYPYDPEKWQGGGPETPW